MWTTGTYTTVILVMCMIMKHVAPITSAIKHHDHQVGEYSTKQPSIFIVMLYFQFICVISLSLLLTFLRLCFLIGEIEFKAKGRALATGGAHG